MDNELGRKESLSELYSEITGNNTYNFWNYAAKFRFKHDDGSRESHHARAHEFCHFMQNVATGMGWCDINIHIGIWRCLYWLCNKIGKPEKPVLPILSWLEHKCSTLNDPEVIRRTNLLKKMLKYQAQTWKFKIESPQIRIRPAVVDVIEFPPAFTINGEHHIDIGNHYICESLGWLTQAVTFMSRGWQSHNFSVDYNPKTFCYSAPFIYLNQKSNSSSLMFYLINILWLSLLFQIPETEIEYHPSVVWIPKNTDFRGNFFVNAIKKGPDLLPEYTKICEDKGLVKGSIWLSKKLDVPSLVILAKRLKKGLEVDLNHQLNRKDNLDEDVNNASDLYIWLKKSGLNILNALISEPYLFWSPYPLFEGCEFEKIRPFCAYTDMTITPKELKNHETVVWFQMMEISSLLMLRDSIDSVCGEYNKRYQAYPRPDNFNLKKIVEDNYHTIFSIDFKKIEKLEKNNI